MSNPPEQRPASRRPITVEIPGTWTPEQALAVYELLDDLRARIWEIYNFRLQDLLQEQRTTPGPDDRGNPSPPTQSEPLF